MNKEAGKSKQFPDFMEEAEKVANEIMELAVKDDLGWRWLYHDHRGIVSTGISLYSGTSGTLYFFIALYNVTQDHKYLDAITGGLKWLMRYDYSNEKIIAIYSGVGGVIYAMIEGYKITGNEEYRTFALDLARDCNSPNMNADILYGTASSIQTLLYLYNETGVQWALQAIEAKTEELLLQTFFPAEGACWERGGNEIRSLCGFAHGASGIGFAFWELYRFFDNEIFRRVAEMAFEYEDQYFEKDHTLAYSKNNWPDFRKDTFTEEGLQALIQAYTANRLPELTDHSFMSAWCHGAPGIGMARLHAYKITNDDRHYQYFTSALQATIAFATKEGNFTYCHGSLGNANLLIDAYVALNDEQSFEIARNAGVNALQHKAERGFFVSGISKTGGEADCDLLNGKAGIGHYYLRLAHPHAVTSPLLPALTHLRPGRPSLSRFDRNYLLSLMYKKAFPNLALILTPGQVIDQLQSQKISCENLIEAVRKTALDTQDVFVANAMSIDLLRLRLSDNIKSNNYFFIRDLVERRKINEPFFHKQRLSDMFKKELLINESVTLQVLPYPNHTQYAIYQVSATGDPINQFTVNEFFFDLLSTFIEKDTIDNSYRTIIQKYFTLEQSAINFGQNYKNHLFEGISKGLLVYSA